ncbi:MAG: cadherin-like domain-containing protein [Clostridia bacterium]|nr:cadherin-like domain-containing protein [Clostridia bacterium]
MKKVLCIFLLAVLLAGSVFSVAASAAFGSGVEVIAEGVTMIKTGLLGQKLCFTDGDFKSAFAITDFKSITVTKLPSSTEGTLLLAGRRVKEGQEIKRRNVAALVFVPASTEVTEASFSFTISEGSGTETVCQMKFIDKINYAPGVPDAKETSLSLSTQSEIPLFGKMEATDPEGDTLQFIIVGYPKNGSIRLTDAAVGTYKYTPEADFTGYDKFSYVARDEYGNYSEVMTVGIRVIERMSSEVFVDMKERSEYNAAVAITAMGIMSSKTVGDDLYFSPDESVTKAEFVAMAMKACGIKGDTSTSSSFFDDNADIPVSLTPYVAKAQRMGIVDGEWTEQGLVFEPNRTITKYEAAMIMSRIVGVKEGDEESSYLEESSVPIFARASIGAMVTLGIFDAGGEGTDYSAGVTKAEAAEYLYRLMSV